MAFQVGHWQLQGAGVWAVEHGRAGPRGDDRILGARGLAGLRAVLVSPAALWGNGYATEGARAALAYAFNTLEKDRVISLIHPENRASIRVAERIGEALQGRVEVLRTEHLVYGIDRQEWARKQSSPAPL